MRFLFLALALLPSFAGACPLGDKESKLTLYRVMTNFGRYTLAPDRVTRKGLADPAAVTDAEIADAAASIQVAESCAAAVVGDRTDSLLPSKARHLTGAERDAYIQLFRDTMAFFLESLKAYEQSFRDQAALPRAQRNFTGTRTAAADMMANATKAHELLQ